MNVATAWLLLEAALLFIGGVAVLALAVILIGRAAAEVSRARVHAAQAAETIDAAREAVEAIESTSDFVRRGPTTRTPPSDDEIREAILAGRQRNGTASIEEEAGREYTTTANAGMDDTDGGFGGGALFHLGEP